MADQKKTTVFKIQNDVTGKFLHRRSSGGWYWSDTGTIWKRRSDLNQSLQSTRVRSMLKGEDLVLIQYVLEAISVDPLEVV